MAAWPAGISAITLFVQDLGTAREFYARTFGQPVHYEDSDSTVFMFGSTMVNLLQAKAATELVEPAPVDTGRGDVRFVLTITVDDVDATCAELAARRVTLLNGPIDRPWGVRTAAFQDPDGYAWEIAH
jgi:catechol 2,3-dioxygenase-like lactoylglutathione lyase family enzyme